MKMRIGTDKNNWRKFLRNFLPKGLQSAARIILPLAAKFHTGSLSGICPHAHVAVKNDPNFLRLRAQTLRGFLDKK
jgi:hypothetical protein